VRSVSSEPRAVGACARDSGHRTIYIAHHEFSKASEGFVCWGSRGPSSSSDSANSRTGVGWRLPARGLIGVEWQSVFADTLWAD
jgi:hypothetical protein